MMSTTEQKETEAVRASVKRGIQQARAGKGIEAKAYLMELKRHQEVSQSEKLSLSSNKKETE